MAHNPPAQPNGSWRVTRTGNEVWETIVVAASATAARDAAKALPPEAWSKRQVLQNDGEDIFEYNVCGSDG